MGGDQGANGAERGPAVPIGPLEPAWVVRNLLLPRVAAVLKQVKRLQRAGLEDPNRPHRLRVSARRASAAVGAFEPVIDSAAAEVLLGRLRKLRRVAGGVRDTDVHRRLLAEAAAQAQPQTHQSQIHQPQAQAESQAQSQAQSREREWLEKLDAVLLARRDKAVRSLGKALQKGLGRRLRRAMKQLGASAVIDASPGASVGAGGLGGGAGMGVGGVELDELASGQLGRSAERYAASLGGNVMSAEGLHELRLAGKKLRYMLEIFAGLDPGLDHPALTEKLAHWQENLGAVNDLATMVAFLDARIAKAQARAEAKAQRAGDSPDHCSPDGSGSDAAAASGAGPLLFEDRSPSADRRMAGPSIDGLRTLRERFETLRERRHRETVAELLAAQPLSWLQGLLPASPIETGVAGKIGSASAAASRRELSGDRRTETLVRAGPGDVVRLAAIDAGSNSIRLLVVEARSDGSYRVLDDEKEVARLGAGVATSGRMNELSMARAAHAVARMRAIAQGYGVSRLKIIGTSACRDAENAVEFQRLVRLRAGTDLEIISAQEEAKLAYISVAHAFDLRGLASAVVDIGGGSTELVLAAGGLTEGLYSLPLGAIRLTATFGGPEEAAGRRHGEMRRHIKRVFRKLVGRPPLSPQIIVGTGGTFTTLANILLSGEGGPSTGAGVPGFEAKRSQVSHLLGRLRAMTPRQRAHTVPGLPAERADIIVAGLAIVERVLKELGVNVVRVHDRGVRDGLIIRMIPEVFGQGEQGSATGGAVAGPGDPMRAVRRFAQACSYEAAHSEHVTALALAIDAQLRELGLLPDAPADQGGVERERLLLEAASVLHDIGYLINYSKHHKHSYHLIVHSDFAPAAGLSRREVLVVAGVARYHRRSEPKMKHPEFAALEPQDRDLVRRLAGILRVADGLDRTHTQNVRDVQLSRRGKIVSMEVHAPEDPATDLWGATRKAGLLESVSGLKLQTRWTPISPSGAVVGA